MSPTPCTLRIRPLLGLVALAISSAAAAQPAAVYGGALQCDGVTTAAQAMSAGIARAGVSTTTESVEWAASLIRSFGLAPALPKDAQALTVAKEASGLLRAGYIVAAKMRHDAGMATVAAYRSSPFADQFSYVLSASTQTVSHASYPSDVRAEGETRPADAKRTDTHGIDLERASGSLVDIGGRAYMAAQLIGKDYETPAVRFYLLSHGFRDSIALEVATAAVCALKLPKRSVDNLNVSARYMAMPAKRSGEDPGAPAPAQAASGGRS